MQPIYLDYNATTPVDPNVFEAIRPYLESHFGNPSSTHSYGATSKIAIVKARKQLAALLNAQPDEIVFTSGGTESNNYAIKGAVFANRDKGNHIIATQIEHPAVLEVFRYLETLGFSATYLPVDAFGRVDPGDVERAITPQTILISVMHANNETGSIQPIETIGKIAHGHGILFHTDAAQSVGKIPVDVESLNVDLLSVAGHKCYAPKGIGALYVRRGVKLEKFVHGADHEANRRAGTENVAGIVGLGSAAALFTANLPQSPTPFIKQGIPLTQFADQRQLKKIQHLRNTLFSGIQDAIPEIRLNGHPQLRLPNTLSIGFPGVEAAILLNEMKGIAASAGAACHSDQPDISGVLAAMQVPFHYAIGTIRFSVGRMTTEEEIATAIPLIAAAYRRLKGENRQHSVPFPYPQGLDSTTKPVATLDIESAISPTKLVANLEVEFQGQDLEPGTLHVGHPDLGPEPKPSVRLTEYTHSLGCACKIRPQLLEKILKNLPLKNNPAILVGHETSDDGAVYKIDDTLALVQTVDFIPPVVDDPYAFGAIAAANALSDIYAMGGTPLFALSIVGFPENRLPLEALQMILQGANDKVSEAGIQIIGGHSIDDNEPKFGLAVTGSVDPGHIYHNNTAKPGDLLILTKPLGTGIITTAIKRGVASEEDIRVVTRLMSGLNKKAADILKKYPVHACTDVTGFGLLGHLSEMLKGGSMGVELFAEKIPVLPRVWDYIAANVYPGGTINNLKHVENLMKWDPRLSDVLKMILADAQTSGGLLIALSAAEGALLLEDFHQQGLTEAASVGVFLEGIPGIHVTGKQVGL